MNNDIIDIEIFKENPQSSGDYNLLENKPSINGVTLFGNKTTEDLHIEPFPFKELIKQSDYLYQVYYDYIDYQFAKQYFNEHRPTINLGACSAIKKGDFYGRNLDWFYNDQVEFAVKIPRINGKYASIGIASGIDNLTKTFVESKQYSELYKILPFMMSDAMNEFGVTCNMNVVSAQKNNGELIHCREQAKDEICDLMLVRYIVDNFKTAREAVEFIRDYVNIYSSKKMYEEFGYDLHFLVADNNETFILEFIESQIVILNATSKGFITNFYNDGVIYNENGSVYTPADVSSGYLPSLENNITSLGSGLERYNLIVNAYNNLNSYSNMRQLLNDLTYTRTYSTSQNPSNPFWFTEYVGGQGDNGELLTIDSLPENFTGIIDFYGQQFLERNREESETWQTTHSVIYDLRNLTATVICQEDANTEKEYKLDFTYIIATEISENSTDDEIPSAKAVWELNLENGTTLTANVDSTNYVLTLKLKNIQGEEISTTNVDLPLEEMIINVEYIDTTEHPKSLKITLKNGNITYIPLTDIIAGLQPQMQFVVMPTASSTYNGKVIQYIGTNDSIYTNGSFYRCDLIEGNYVWTKIEYGLTEEDTILVRNTIPTASLDLASQTIYYTGITTSNYTQNHIYQCQQINNVWTWVDITPSVSGSIIDIGNSMGQAGGTTVPLITVGKLKEIMNLYTTTGQCVLKWQPVSTNTAGLTVLDTMMPPPMVIVLFNNNVLIYTYSLTSLDEDEITPTVQALRPPLYTSTGQNEDGAMTQKAVTDALTEIGEVINVGLNQVTIDGYVFPTISKTLCDTIYQKYVEGKPFVLYWTTTNIDTHFSVISANDILGYEFQCILHGKQIKYNWVLSSTGNIAPTIVESSIPTSYIPLTTAPTADNTDGTIKVVLLNSDPETYYDGYDYRITEE